jgi:hypothetical protein
LLLTATCLVTPPAGCPASGAPPSQPAAATAESRLIAAKAEIMKADYGADLAALARLREEVLRLACDPQLGHLARYWAGFASWRTSINGASHGMSREDLRANLERAAADFEASVLLRPDFADGYAGAAGVDSWLPLFLEEGTPARQEVIDGARRNLKRAKELAPDNPRMLWVWAGPYLFVPVSQGGNPAKAIEIYHRMIEVAAPLTPGSPLPDWGKPEALMSLAYAHLNAAPIDLEAATKEARAALDLQPGWSYVKDILVPQIEKAKAAAPPQPAKPPQP